MDLNESNADSTAGYSSFAAPELEGNPGDLYTYFNVDKLTMKVHCKLCPPNTNFPGWKKDRGVGGNLKRHLHNKHPDSFAKYFAFYISRTVRKPKLGRRNYRFTGSTQISMSNCFVNSSKGELLDFTTDSRKNANKTTSSSTFAEGMTPTSPESELYQRLNSTMNAQGNILLRRSGSDEISTLARNSLHENPSLVSFSQDSPRVSTPPAKRYHFADEHKHSPTLLPSTSIAIRKQDNIENSSETFPARLHDIGQATAPRFFCQVQSFFAFFGRSLANWDILCKHCPLANLQTRSTRWTGDVNQLEILSSQPILVYEALNEIYESFPIKQDESLVLMWKLRDLEFLVTLLLWRAVLSAIKPVVTKTNMLLTSQTAENSLPYQAIVDVWVKMEKLIDSFRQDASFQAICNKATSLSLDMNGKPDFSKSIGPSSQCLDVTRPSRQDEFRQQIFDSLIDSSLESIVQERLNFESVK